MTVNYQTGEIVEPDFRPSLPVDRIVIGERARKDYGDLTALVESIREHGVLQPVGVLPGNRLLFGGRRLEACRRLGMTSIPITRPQTRDDALAQLKAERDENTCRKDMTPEELVDLGLQIEELERPRAEERMRAGVATNPGPTGAQGPDKPESGRTAAVVGEALGVSSNTYKRMKHVVTTARDEDEEPEVRQAAAEALAKLNAGEKDANVISDILREHGWTVSPTAGTGYFAAVTAIEKVYNGASITQGPREDLVHVVAEVVGHAWGRDSRGAHNLIIGGLGQLYARFGGNVDSNKVAAELAKMTPHAVIGRAKTLQDARGGTVVSAVAEVVTGLHNKGRRTNLLPEWRWSR